jgi:hemolysin activation/secretion protein
MQGQATDNALVDSEQFSMGGLNTVRGYLESQVVGDSAIGGTLELQSPSLLSWSKNDKHELRLIAFTDAGSVFINDPLPEQIDQFNLWSYGFGATAKIHDWLNGALVVGFPLIGQTGRGAGDPLLTFRVWGEL